VRGAEADRNLRILVIEDSEDDLLLLQYEFKRAGYAPHIERVETSADMRHSLLEDRWDIIIADYILPRFSGLEALAILKDSGQDIPLIIVSGKIGEDIAVEAMRAGAQDYIVKGNLGRLVPAVERELREADTRRLRRMAEEALKESQAMLGALAATAADAMVMMDDSGRVTYWSPSAVRIFGYNEQEAIGAELHNLLVPGKLRDSFKNVLQRVVDTERAPAADNRFEFPAVRRDGTEFPVEVSLSTLELANRRQAVGIIRDITERKRAEVELLRHRDHLGELVEERTAALRQTNEHLQQEIQERLIVEEALWKAVSRAEEEKAKSEAIIAAMGDGVVIHDTDFRILYQNRIHREMFGDHVGGLCYKAYFNSDEVCEDCPVQKAFGDLRNHTAEKIFTNAGGIFHTEITASPLKDAEGKILAGIMIVRDISERKNMEDELREHRDHLDFLVRERTAELRKVNKELRAEIMRRIQMEKDLIESQRFVQRIADATPNLLYLYDVVENKNVYINPRVQEILGYSAEDVRRAGSSFFKAFGHSDDLNIIESLRERFSGAKDGDIVESHNRMKNAQGEWRWFHSRNVVFKRTSDGLPKLILGVAQDITEQREAEDELKSSRQQLRHLLAHLQSVREDERTRISREIHDELGQSLTALKMDVSLLIRRFGRNQKELREKAQSMSKLIDMNIKTVKRISAELRPGLLDELGLTAALEWQAEEFQERTGIKCELAISPEDITLDRNVSTTIFRVFQETLTNIVRHARAKNVSIDLREEGGQITLCVADDGKGITKSQVSSPKSIGLIGIRERVAFLGGDVNFAGEKDGGTTVTVTIPIGLA
jgi:PAS domain S-box-containing protein